MSELAIPLDDSGLDAIDHALGGVIHIEDDGEWRREGADYSEHDLIRALVAEVRRLRSEAT